MTERIQPDDAPASGEHAAPAELTPEPTGHAVKPTTARPAQPNLAVGFTLLTVAAVLIVIVLVQPAMSSGLKTVIAIVAVAVVAALLGFATKLWLSTQRAARTSPTKTGTTRPGSTTKGSGT